MPLSHFIAQHFLSTSATARSVSVSKICDVLMSFHAVGCGFYSDIIWAVHPTKSSSFMDQKASRRFDRQPAIRFNTSHSGQMALHAFTRDCELGVDVEQLRDLDDPEAIATRFFSSTEVSELLSLRPGDRGLAFLRCWTRKEAYVKSIGDGLAIPLNHFQVTLLPGVPARFVQVTNNMGTASDWTLNDLELAAGYVGALAYRDSLRPTTIHPPVRADNFQKSSRQAVPRVETWLCWTPCIWGGASSACGGTLASPGP